MKANILFVDDEGYWRDYYSSKIRNLGYDITIVSNIKNLKKEISKIDYDLIIMDICLDENDPLNTEGIYIIPTLKTLRPYTEIIMLTVRNPEEHPGYIRDAIKLGAFYYISKNKDELLDVVINNALERRKLFKKLNKRQLSEEMYAYLCDRISSIRNSIHHNVIQLEDDLRNSEILDSEYTRNIKDELKKFDVLLKDLKLEVK